MFTTFCCKQHKDIKASGIRFYYPSSHKLITRTGQLNLIPLIDI
jgi:hypothetical protein